MTSSQTHRHTYKGKTVYPFLPAPSEQGYKGLLWYNKIHVSISGYDDNSNLTISLDKTYFTRGEQVSIKLLLSSRSVNGCMMCHLDNQSTTKSESFHWVDLLFDKFLFWFTHLSNPLQMMLGSHYLKFTSQNLYRWCWDPIVWNSPVKTCTDDAGVP